MDRPLEGDLHRMYRDVTEELHGVESRLSDTNREKERAANRYTILPLCYCLYSKYVRMGKQHS